MKKVLYTVAMAAMAAFALSCSKEESIDSIAERVGKVAVEQCTLMDGRLTSETMPRTYSDGKVTDSGLGWWCSGFFPGTCWLTYELTGNEDIKAIAEKETMKLTDLSKLANHHDIGFQVNCSFGNALRLTGDEQYKDYIVRGAEKLAKRFSPVTGVIMSWDPNEKKNWKYPVIIDNMMNLEILMKGTELSGNDTLSAIACTHALTTMKNHFRPDYTTWHVVSYDPETGEPVIKCTGQGYSDDSAWGRGQAWAVYGYTMMAEKTGREDFLKQAENIADMLLGKLPEDGIPYWDFNAPDIPDALRDASAGAIMASAFVELSGLVKDPAKSKAYNDMALKQIRTLASPEYLAAPGENGDFLLKHSVGNKPGNSEVDVPLTYADYYFLEAILREKNR